MLLDKFPTLEKQFYENFNKINFFPKELNLYELNANNHSEVISLLGEDLKNDIPIFGMDLVKINDNVSAAIVDLSPASQNQGLKYEKLLSEVDKSSFTSLREIPKWGSIFSNNVFFASLKSKSEKNDFCRVVDQYLSILIKLSKKAKPEVNEEIIQERIDFQKNYCVQQMKNEKTSMVLLKYFDEKWVNNYIKTVLFDF